MGARLWRIAGVAALACVAVGHAAFAATLVVANKDDATVSLLDLPSGRIVATVPTGDGPHEVAISPDGRQAVVSNTGDREHPGSTLTLLDIAAAKALRTIDLGSYRLPHGLAWLRGGEVLVTVEPSKALLAVNVRNGRTRRIPLPQALPHMLVVTPGGDEAFVANMGAGSVTAIDVASGRRLADIKTGAGAEGIDISPNGREVWVTNRAANTVSVIDVPTLTLLLSIDVPATGPIRAKVTPDGRRVLVANARTGDVSVIAAEERRVERRLDTGLGPNSAPVGLLIDPSGARAYVAHAGSDRITVFDLATWKHVASWPTGRVPDGLGWSPVTVRTGHAAVARPKRRHA